MKLFSINRDTQIGALKEDNKTMGDALENINKVAAARNDPATVKRVHDLFTRGE